jgi:hypothetical protein
VKKPITQSQSLLIAMSTAAATTYNPFSSAFTALTNPQAIAFYKRRAAHDSRITNEVLWAIAVTVISVAILCGTMQQPSDITPLNAPAVRLALPQQPQPLALLMPRILDGELDSPKPGVRTTLPRPERPVDLLIKMPAQQMNKRELLFMIRKLSPKPIKRLYSLTRNELENIYAVL